MGMLPGTRVGPYEIVSPIGAGGMGEVYRARDSRLERDVAIKVLPSGFADNPERRARFEREAKAIAALSHPNILAIHDIGESRAQDAATGQSRSILYVVTELLEGETLRERVTHGALPVRKAIDAAVQIARGLAAAHDRGIVHRDLKPENLFLLADGQIKILDFGLAKGFSKESTSGAADATATATALAMTDPGSVMGTVGYMAPEQIRGQALDARTDLFAFGAVLYEMLSGQRAFRRDTAAETMTAILREDPPDLTASRTDLPLALERIVRHCLEKNPSERFQTARDVGFALEAFSGTAITSSKVAVLPARTRWFSSAAIAAAFAIAGVAAGYGLSVWLRRAPSGTDINFETRTFDPQWITNSRFAPDGRTIVFSAASVGNVPSLFVLRPGALIPQPLGQPNTHLLSISRTGELAVLTGGRYIGHRLFVGGTLSRVTMDGAARPIVERVREADWGADGTTMAIVRDLGTSDQLEYPVDHKLAETSGYFSDPRVSPDGSRVAFLEHPTRYDDRGWVKIVDRAGAVRTISDELWGAEGLAWSPDGRTILVAASILNAFGYQPYAVNADGPPNFRAVLPMLTSAEVMDIAADGRVLLNASEDRISLRALLPGESTEREFPFLDLPLPRDLTDDGKWMVFADESMSAGQNYAVAWRKTDGSPPVRLGEGAPVALSPDAKWVLAFVPSPTPGHYAAYPTGPGQTLPVDFSPVQQVRSIAFFPDGKLFFCGNEPNKPRRCYRKELSGGVPEAITPENVVEGSPAPDGHSMAIGMATGAVQMMDLAGGAPVTIPHMSLNENPVGWSSDSRGILVATDDIPGWIERVDVRTGARTRIREIMPPDRSGIIKLFFGRVFKDGNAYSYGYWRQTSKAVIASGLKIR